MPARGLGGLADAATSLDGTRVGAAGAATIAAALRSCPGLLTLKYVRRTEGTRWPPSYSPWRRVLTRRRSRVWPRRSVLNADIGDSGAQAIAAALEARACPALSSLRYARAPLAVRPWPLRWPTLTAADAHGGRTRAMPALRPRSLGGNNIGDVGARAIAAAIAKCPLLVTLRYTRR